MLSCKMNGIDHINQYYWNILGYIYHQEKPNTREIIQRGPNIHYPLTLLLYHPSVAMKSRLWDLDSAFPSRFRRVLSDRDLFLSRALWFPWIVCRRLRDHVDSAVALLTARYRCHLLCGGLYCQAAQHLSAHLVTALPSDLTLCLPCSCDAPTIIEFVQGNKSPKYSRNCYAKYALGWEWILFKKYLVTRECYTGANYQHKPCETHCNSQNIMHDVKSRYMQMIPQ